MALPVWGLAIPLPAVLIIALSLYLLVLGLGFWLRSCLKDRCALWCDGCCPDISPASEQCCRLEEVCDWKLPSMSWCWWDRPINPCANWDCANCDCANWDCACTCQPPECDSCNCLCFEIRVR